MPAIQIVGGAYQGSSKDINSQECINLYPTYDKTGGLPALVATPGLKPLWTAESADPVRWMSYNPGYTYVVYHVTSDKIYKRSLAGGGATQLGTLSSGTPYFKVYSADNQQQAFLVDHLDGYKLTHGATPAFSTITDTDFPAYPRGAAFLNGYFLVGSSQSGDGTIHKSALNDCTTWGATDYSVAQTCLEGIQGVVDVVDQLFIFGLNSYEIWYYSGNVSFPFERIPGAVIPIGCSQWQTITKYQRSIYFISSQQQAVRTVGFDYEVISTPEIDYIIRTNATSSPKGIRAHIEEIDGHVFWVVTQRSGTGPRPTLVYDITTGIWHQRQSPGSNEYCGSAFVQTYGHWMVGSETGEIYDLDPSYYMENGVKVARTRTIQHLSAGSKLTFHNRLDVKFQYGLKRPVLYCSDDRGRTWSKGILPMGRFTNEASWYALGAAYDRTYKLVVKENKPVIITGAFLEYKARDTWTD